MAYPWRQGENSDSLHHINYIRSHHLAPYQSYLLLAKKTGMRQVFERITFRHQELHKSATFRSAHIQIDFPSDNFFHLFYSDWYVKGRLRYCTTTRKLACDHTYSMMATMEEKNKKLTLDNIIKIITLTKWPTICVPHFQIHSSKDDVLSYIIRSFQQLYNIHI